jgi:potassium efflux system protein
MASPFGPRVPDTSWKSSATLHRSLGMLLVAVVVLVGHAVAAQNAAVAEATPTIEGPRVAPIAIPLSDVGVESERAKSQLKDGLRILMPTATVEAAASAIPALDQQVETELERSRAVRTATPSVLAIDRLQGRWKSIEDALAGTQTVMRRRAADIDLVASSARNTRAVWTTTRASAVELNASSEIIGQIDEVLTSAVAVIGVATERQAEIVGLSGRVARMSEAVADDQKEISAARSRAVSQALTRDTTPIWGSGFWQRGNLSRVAEQLAAQRERDEAILSDFWATDRDLVAVFVVCSGLLVALAFAARRRVERRLAGDADLASVRAIFAKPIALSMLTAFFVSLWIFRGLATTFEPLFGAVTLIPAVIILRQVLDRPLYPLMNVAVSVYFAHSFHETFTEAAVLSRLIFLAEMLALAVYSANALRPAKLGNAPREMLTSRLFRTVAYGLRAVFVFSSIAFVAEATGFGALADLIGGALIISIYAAIVLYGTLRVLDGLVAFAIRVRPLRLLGMVARHQWLVRRRINGVLQIAAWYFWIRVTLRRAELWDDVALGWRSLGDAELPFPEITITVGNVVAAAIVFWGALLFSRFLQFALEEDVYSRVSLPKGRPYAISTLLHYAMLVLGLVLAAAALGFDANRATLLTGAFGVGIGFGLQTIVSNFISGIILLTERPIQVGDSIAMGDVLGEVQRIGIRSCTVRTWQGAEVIVPNADLIAQQVTNWTKSDSRRRIEIPVGVKYGSDPQLVIDTLLRATVGVERLLPDPAPVVLFQGFGDSALDFELRAWTGEFDSFMQTRSAICVRIAACLAEAGIEVPFPQRDLHLRTIATAGRPADPLAEPTAPTRANGDDARATG